MKQGVLLFLLAILLGCTGNKRVDNSPIVEVTDSVMVAKGYDEVELFKTRTGHITATLSVNGKPCIFLIDTGGGATLIDKSMKYPTSTPSSGRTMPDRWTVSWEQIFWISTKPS